MCINRYWKKKRGWRDEEESSEDFHLGGYILKAYIFLLASLTQRWMVQRLNQCQHRSDFGHVKQQTIQRNKSLKFSPFPLHIILPFLCTYKKLYSIDIYRSIQVFNWLRTISNRTADDRNMLLHYQVLCMFHWLMDAFCSDAYSFWIKEKQQYHPRNFF